MREGDQDGPLTDRFTAIAGDWPFVYSVTLIGTDGVTRDRVVRGGVIAYVGHSGNAKVPQLHFAVREGNNSIDPLSKLPQQLAMR